ncbi:MAG TPA: flagellar motor switch protein FliM [Bryobacteraceae bacterium]|nr:flagellar motor switch protein FliM [Bryobacteraceae bacterium]
MNSRQSETGKTAGQKLDLGQQDSTPQFRKLRSIHEIFAKSLSNVLSTFLQAEIQANLAAMNVTTAGEFQKNLANPSCLIKLRLHPEQERMILYLDSATVLTLLEIFLGGGGQPSPEPRELTEIEWSLLEEISRVMMRCLGESWQVIKPVEFVVESLNSDPSLTPCPEPALSVLRIAFDLELGEQSGHFEMAVPRSFFDAVAPAAESPELMGETPSALDMERNARLLEDAEVELEVLLEGTHLSFGDLRALRQGQVVRFDHGLNQPLRGVVNGDLTVIGHVLSAGNKRAFQVEERP